MKSADDSKAGGIYSMRVLLWKRDLVVMLGVGLRTLERMISSGEVPAPDRRLRGRPVWLTTTIQDWLRRSA